MIPNKIDEILSVTLTKDKAKEWYEKKYLTTAGYLLSIKKLTTGDKNFTITSISDFCVEWGINKSSFYRAIKVLVQLKELDWEVTEGIALKDPTKVQSIIETEND